MEHKHKGCWRTMLQVQHIRKSLASVLQKIGGKLTVLAITDTICTSGVEITTEF
ncbi:hypothetical protein ACP70R_017277 [Stipagrostis hirtigluma subsp. patula]